MVEDGEARRVLDICPVGVVVFAEARLAWLNEALAQWLGIEPAAVIGRTRSDVAPGWLRSLFERPAELHVPAGGERPERILAGCTRRFGDHELLFYRDVTAERALAREQERLRSLLAEHVPRDPLTGLLNSRGLFRDLEPQVSRSRRYHNPLSVVLMRLPDVDPRAGDGRALLVAAAQQLRDQTRWADTVGRLDDSAEFMLILPETPEEGAILLVEKLRGRLTALADSGTSAAFGWAAWRRGDDPRLLVRRARERLDAAPGE